MLQTCDQYDTLYTGRELAGMATRQLTNQLLFHTLSKPAGAEYQT
jgi:hypothetical protein